MDHNMEKLKAAENIYVYGAGAFGRRVFAVLASYDLELKVKGYIVSDASQYQSNPGVPPVLGIEQIEKDAFIVIALSPQYHVEVTENLRKKGFENYIIWSYDMINDLWRSCQYKFTDRQKGFQKVCFVLAGYKEFLWNDVFDRLCRFLPLDVEVCILSSGIRDERLECIAKKNDWSYLSTNRNSITLVQNIAAALYDKAIHIYKMDEDIFLTEGCFEKMMSVYNMVENEGRYDAGCVVPLIPVNAYGYIPILEQTDCLDQYERIFEPAMYGATPIRMIENDYRTAEFMWGYNSPVPSIDKLNRSFQEKGPQYNICGVRFSIGFILYEKKFWEDMGGFLVSGNVDLGLDEVEICQQCITESKALIVAENTVVGHFSFGKQTGKMRELYTNHHELFEVCE